MSRRVEDMHPALQPRVRAVKADWAAAGEDVLVTCTHRTNVEQDGLFAIGRTKPGKIVTRARGGESNHNNYITIKGVLVPASLAFDFVPLRYGKLIWGTAGDGLDDDPSDDHTDDKELWQRCANIAKAHGFKWFGEPNAAFREYPHLEDVTPLT